VWGQLLYGRGELGQVVGAVRAGRRADGQEVHVAVLAGTGEVGREPESSGADVAGQESVELGLVEPAAAGVQSVDLSGVDVDAEDVVADLGHASCVRGAKVPGADDGDLQQVSFV
jgi:hypothetical protein